MTSIPPRVIKRDCWGLPLKCGVARNFVASLNRCGLNDRTAVEDPGAWEIKMNRPRMGDEEGYA